MKNKIGLLQNAIDNKLTNEEFIFQKMNVEENRINVDGSNNINIVPGVSGSAKNNSRSINAINRQVNNKQSNRHGS